MATSSGPRDGISWHLGAEMAILSGLGAISSLGTLKLAQTDIPRTPTGRDQARKTPGGKAKGPGAGGGARRGPEQTHTGASHRQPSPLITRTLAFTQHCSSMNLVEDIMPAHAATANYRPAPSAETSSTIPPPRVLPDVPRGATRTAPVESTRSRLVH